MTLLKNILQFSPRLFVYPVLQFLEKHIPLLKKEGAIWGYDIPYLLTGRLNQHPSAAIDYTKENRSDYAEFYTDLLDK